MMIDRLEGLSLIHIFLQSAFFKLADVMPIEDAVNFMKQAAQKSYGKKGQDVVEMNWKAIDAGVDAIHKVDVPASWSNPEADPAPKACLLYTSRCV